MTEQYLERLRDPWSGPIRIHLIGVAGSGMSGLASLLMGMGHRVSGCDRVTTVETERLETVGLRFRCPQTADTVDGAEMVIYSSAIKPGNPAYDAAVAQGISLVRRAEALAAIMDQRLGIVVSGTHGKTTTSAMAAHVLRSGGLKPSHYVGAEIPLLGTNAHWRPEGEHFVAEGDESDGTLALFHPQHAIVLNIEEEHLDFYDGIEAINAVFRQLLDQTRGFFIYCGDDAGARAVCAERERGISYGLTDGLDYVAKAIEERRGSTVFTVVRNEVELGEMELSIPGRHNVLNALSVCALATELGVTFGIIKAALGAFRGAQRRFQLKFQSDDYVLYDDYGHHPTEIVATLQTARQLEPKRVLCVFQPHRFSRTQLLKEEFGNAFDQVDELVVTDIYPASEKPIPGITGATICDAVRAHNPDIRVTSVPQKELARFAIGNRLKPDDLLISLGAGDVHEITTSIAKDLETRQQLLDEMDDGESTIKLYEPMSKHTTMRIGGPAQFWVEPRTIAGLARLLVHCRKNNIPIRIIGRGSNLLVRDGGIEGVVIHPTKGDFDRINVQGERIEVGAGVRLRRVSLAAKEAGLAGFGWMEGIPGNIGGAIRMNAGAMGVEMFDQAVSVTFIDQEGAIRTKAADEIDFRYRNVPEFTENFVVSAVFEGKPGEIESIKEEMDESKHHRQTTQPAAASAGCIFKNPEVCGAGQLVDELGLKNTGVGGVRVSEVHGNFIVNDGGASATDALALIEKIKAKAREERDVELETEVQILGTDAPW
ncbi:MAG: UDP-N-acetylmuramate--L-alanine ligase [Verrucomicrobiota bacterium]